MTVKDYEHKAILSRIEKESLQKKDFLQNVSRYSKFQLERINSFSFELDKSMKQIDEIIDYYKQKYLRSEGIYALLSVGGIFIQPMVAFCLLAGGSIFNLAKYLKHTKKAKKVLDMNLDLKDELLSYQAYYENYLDYNQKREKLYPIIYMEMINKISRLNINQARKFLERVKEICAFKDSETFYLEMKKLEEEISMEKTDDISALSYEFVGYYYVLDELLDFIREYDHVCSVVTYAKIKIDSILNEEDRNAYNEKLAQIVLEILTHHEEELKLIEHMIDLKHCMKLILLREYPELESSSNILSEGIQKRKENESKLVLS